jgi:hypothetical protein
VPGGRRARHAGRRPDFGERLDRLAQDPNGDWSIPASELECLLERKLIEITSGLVRLTQNGYVALGLPV